MRVISKLCKWSDKEGLELFIKPSARFCNAHVLSHTLQNRVPDLRYKTASKLPRERADCAGVQSALTATEVEDCAGGSAFPIVNHG
ncbi:hypothetical protein M407DRAFT_243365 [Tulasnella calospora MUT 4182]|uniref:Uncharacterized protein n=1 Tax=Tulasnella calospora MUT 4182 TaxID=1051891 RepID=A0A0C3QJT0_9AGAM|nr:hypothetical protein M407DRAFT_243365 [Tulasnella calospora MUT 4182]